MAAPQAQGTKKREKPLLKKLVPGTDWLRVITNQGNIFYFNKSRKESAWTAPGDILELVAAMEQQEKEDKQKAQQDMLDKAARAEETKQMEVDRIKKEMKGIIKRKADEETPLDELVIAKKARVEDEDEDEDEDEGSSEEDEEEEWQREAAAQLAAEAEEEHKRQEEERKRKEEEERQKEKETEMQRVQAAGLINMPEKVDLSIEEAKALFKVSRCGIDYVSRFD